MSSQDATELPNGTSFTKKNDMSMIVIMGVTGSGKSYFINQLAGGNVVQEGKNLDSCTQNCQMVPVVIGNSKILLIDTPGFDDTARPDADILNEIARVLAAQYSLGFELKGIVYVHRITDIRYSGSNVKTFEIFKRICGPEALDNVILLTSRWNEIDEGTGSARERQLQETFWAYMVTHGSCITRFRGDHYSAVGVISQLLIKCPVVLQLQHEMINEGKNLNETAAGSFVDDGLQKSRDEFLKDIQSLERLRGESGRMDRNMKMQVNQDWEREQGRLRAAEDQRASLRRDVMGEVQGEMKDETKTRSRGLRRFLPLIPLSLSILGMFVGIPPGSFELLSDFIMDLPSILSGSEA